MHMKTIPLAMLGMAMACPPAAPQGSQIEVQISDRTVRRDAFPSVGVEYPGGVLAYPQVEFANLAGFRPLRMDIYMPEAPKRRPAILWVHGGGWSRGDSRTSGAYADWPRVLASLAARGYVVGSVDYRLSSEARFPAQVQDVNAAVRHLRAHAQEYGVDPSRIYIWGGSAGGHLAALAATTCNAAEYAPTISTGRLERREMQAAVTAARAPLRGESCVQGAAIWYGLFDLEKAGTTNVTDLLGCDPTQCRDTARAASPIHRVSASAPPMLLIHGQADGTAPAQASIGMAEKLRAAGVQVELMMIPGADHGWLGNTPAETRDASLLALRRTFAFFDSLSPGRGKRGVEHRQPH